MTEEDQLAEALAQEEIRDVTVDTVLSHEARHGGKFDEYFKKNEESREKKAITGQISFTEYINGDNK